MPVNISRALLQVLYLERYGAPRTPNTLRELLGVINVRERDGETPLTRKTIDLHGAAYIADDPSGRAVQVYTGADLMIEPAISGTLNDYAPAGWDDASMLVPTLSGATTISGFDAFSCTRWEKLIFNRTGGILTIAHENTSSVHDNRVICATGAAIDLDPGEGAWLIRDHVSARWRCKAVIVGGTPAGIEGGHLDFSEDGNPWSPQVQ